MEQLPILRIASNCTSRNAEHPGGTGGTHHHLHHPEEDEDLGEDGNKDNGDHHQDHEEEEAVVPPGCARAAEQFPPLHARTLAALLRHLARVAAPSLLNQMPAGHLAIVFGPTLLRMREGSASLSSLVDTVQQTRVIEVLIESSSTWTASFRTRRHTANRSSRSPNEHCALLEAVTRTA
ncbi:hypothetical protein MTO96_002404 [Rhipicephalus appendiculatus]